MPLPGSPQPGNDDLLITEGALRARLSEVTASEVRLRQLMNADPFSILIGTTAGEIRYMNPPLRQMLGYSAEAVDAGEVRWTALTPPEFESRDQRAIEELHTTGRARLYEKEFLTHDGRRVPVLLGASMISDGHSGQEVVCFIADLTDLQRVQRDLRESETSVAVSDERSRQLLRANPFGMMIGKQSGRMEYMNPPMLRMLKYDPENTDPTKIDGFALTPPEWKDINRQATDRVMRDGFCPAFEKEYFARDGSRVPVLVGLTLIPNLEGGRDIAAFVTDLTQLKQTEGDLRESRRQLDSQFAEMETLYRTAPIGLAFFDPKEYRYLRLNDAQAEIIGKPKEEILGRTLTEIAPIPGLREMFDRVAAGIPIVNAPLSGELPSRPGEMREWTVNYYPVFSQTGELQGITAASLEITPQKRAEAALQVSEKLAAVGRLASSISHEINNPLEAITNLLYLARHEEDAGKIKEYIQSAEHEVARVSQIATQTLRFHRQPGNPTLVSAADLVDPVVALYAGRLMNANIRIERKYRTTTRFACMEGDMRQVMNNLIGNAIDAMRGGGRLLARSALISNAAGELRVRITIADTGAGMSAETRRRIFDAFYTTKGIGGTGLGMWISKGIVDKHAGTLRLRSNDRAGCHGTVFQLTMPLDARITPDPENP